MDIGRLVDERVAEWLAGKRYGRMEIDSFFI